MRHPPGLPESMTAVDRTLVMGILNVTPDSFSDGGRYFDHDVAVNHGLAMSRAGADLVDVGGESTRPGATPVPSDEERRRVVEVVRDLAAEGVPVSIDTRHEDVARACVAAGAVLVNDVSAGRGDEAMWPFIAESGVAYVLMHNQGTGIAQPQQRVGSSPLRVWQELAARVAEASAAGIDRTRLVVDPGFGFGKDPDLNWQLVGNDPAAMAEEAGIGGYPILFGVSRKRFLAARPDGRLREEDSMEQRDRLTVALTEQAVRGGVWCVRVHDVAPNAEVVRRLRPDGWMAP